MSDYSDLVDAITQQDLSPHKAANTYVALRVRSDGALLAVCRRSETEFEAHDRRTLSYEIPLDTDIGALRELLGDGGAAPDIIGRIREGHTLEWSGGNKVGRLDDDARAAEVDLRALLDALPVSEFKVWSADAYLSVGRPLIDNGLSATSTEEDIEGAAYLVIGELDENDAIHGGKDAVVEFLTARVAEALDRRNRRREPD